MPVPAASRRASRRHSYRGSPLPKMVIGGRRDRGGVAFPPAVADGIRAIARRERWSVSRVISWLVCDWFKLNADTGQPRAHHATAARWSPEALVRGARRESEKA